MSLTATAKQDASTQTRTSVHMYACIRKRPQNLKHLSESTRKMFCKNSGALQKPYVHQVHRAAQGRVWQQGAAPSPVAYLSGKPTLKVINAFKRSSRRHPPRVVPYSWRHHSDPQKNHQQEPCSTTQPPEIQLFRKTAEGHLHFAAQATNQSRFN